MKSESNSSQGRILLMILALSAPILAGFHPGFPMASPWVHTPQMDPYANMGLMMSAYPPPKTNTFSKQWQQGGYKSMYNLNYMAPYAMDVAVHGHGHTPLMSQMHFNTFPTFLTNGQYNPYGFNLSDPRYHALYQRYYGFYNRDLNLLRNMAPHKYHFDYNNVKGLRDGYPDNFDYTKTFDGGVQRNMPAAFLTVPGVGRSAERHLQLIRRRPHRSLRRRNKRRHIRNKVRGAIRSKTHHL